MRGTLSLLGQTTTYPTRPKEAKLEWFPVPPGSEGMLVTFVCTEFTSICPKTGQPDFGTWEIEYAPHKRMLESKSLKLYLGAYRSTGAFWEALTYRIARDLVRVLEPKRLTVRGQQGIRGGIGIKTEFTWTAPS